MNPTTFSLRRGDEIYFYVLGRLVMKRWVRSRTCVMFQIMPQGSLWWQDQNLQEKKKMNIAALDQDGIIVSIVEVNDTWWLSGTVRYNAIEQLVAAGFMYYEPDTVGPKEIERRITGQPEFDEWVSTLQPA